MKLIKIIIILFTALFSNILYCQDEWSYSPKEKLKKMYSPAKKINKSITISCLKSKTINKISIKRQVIVLVAKSLIGIGYWPSDDPEDGGIDCSGLTHYSYMKAGIKIPRTVFEQYRAAKIISMRLAQKGDLVFFGTYAPWPTHVGIYLGNGKFIHAPSATKCVQTDSLYKPYWSQHFISAGTFFNNL